MDVVVTVLVLVVDVLVLVVPATVDVVVRVVVDEVVNVDRTTHELARTGPQNGKVVVVCAFANVARSTSVNASFT